MVRKAFSPEQIINKLRETEVYISRGISIAEATERLASPLRPIIAGVKSI